MNFAERVKIRELTPFEILFTVATPNYCFDLSTTVIGDLCVFSASCSPFSLKGLGHTSPFCRVVKDDCPDLMLSDVVGGWQLPIRGCTFGGVYVPCIYMHAR